MESNKSKIVEQTSGLVQGLEHQWLRSLASEKVHNKAIFSSKSPKSRQRAWQKEEGEKVLGRKQRKFGEEEAEPRRRCRAACKALGFTED